MHPHAEGAAEAAEAAAAQGRFWEMHDLLYENQRHLLDNDLRSYAQALGLDVDMFNEQLAEHVHADRVHEDLMSVVRSGVNGTPTFFINRLRHDASYGFETLLLSLQRILCIVAASGATVSRTNRDWIHPRPAK